MKIMKNIMGTRDRINEAHFIEQFYDPQIGQFKIILCHLTLKVMEK